MTYIFRLIRPANLFIIAATMYSLGWYFDHLLTASGIPAQLASADFFLLVFSTVLIAAAGNIINDYFDIKADRINRPERIIISKHIKRRWAILLHWVINFIAFAIATYLSYRNQTFWYVFIHLLSINLLWYYSMQLKRTLVVGNIIIALLTALVPVLVGIFYNQQLGANELYMTFPFLMNDSGEFMILVSIGLGIFAFTLNWAREIVKDIEDMEGDKILKAKTIPIVLGVKKSKVFTVLLLILTIALALFLLPGRKFIVDMMAFLPILLSAVTILLALFILLNAETKKQFRLSHSCIKITMIFGLILPLYWTWMIIYY